LNGAALRAVPRQVGLEAEGALRVDTANAAPASMGRFRELNPFTVNRSRPLAVPGRPDLLAYSVEAIWQGLKLVDGSTDLAQLQGEPHKRPPEDERDDPSYRYEDSCFLLGEEVLDLVSARRRIYVPAYLEMIELRLPAAVEAEIAAAREAGGEVLFYDWDANFDLADPSGSFSHSALLADWFSGRLEAVLADCGLSPGSFPRYLAHHGRPAAG
jgi:hypothetical protein